RRSARRCRMSESRAARSAVPACSASVFEGEKFRSDAAAAPVNPPPRDRREACFWWEWAKNAPPPLGGSTRISQSVASRHRATEAPDMQPATILVVDDTADILALTSSVLENAGYAVLRCSGSQQALAVLRDGHDIDLLLTDIAMPGIDGFELARQARVARPLLPIAYLTGHPHLADGNGAALGPILKKPYRPDGLAREVEELLAPGEDARLVKA